MEQITIQSKITIYVTPNIKIKDVTNKNDINNPRRLNAVMDWQHDPVKILVGVGEYPSYIREWDTVKALIRNRIITIAEKWQDTSFDIIDVKPQIQAEKEEKEEVVVSKKPKAAPKL